VEYCGRNPTASAPAAGVETLLVPEPLVPREMWVEIKLSTLALRVMTTLIIEPFIARAGRLV
jgi:hypothetical protein